MNTLPPIRPEDSEKTEEEIVRERLASFDEDVKTALPWEDVRQRILEQTRSS